MSGIVGDNQGRSSGLVKAAGGGGAWNLVSLQTASSSSVLEWNTQITSTYDTYKLIVTNAHTATDTAQFYLQYRQDAAYLTATNYRWAAGRILDGTTISATGNTGSSQVQLTNDGTGTATGENFNFEVTLWDFLGTDNYKCVHWNGNCINQDGSTKQELGCGIFTGGVTALDGFKVYMSSGNIASGDFALYGLAKE